MISILRMEHSYGTDPVYVVAGGALGIEWMDDREVIQMLAEKGMRAKTAKVDREELTAYAKDLFDYIWNDEPEVDLDDAFDTLFSVFIVRNFFDGLG